MTRTPKTAFYISLFISFRPTQKLFEYGGRAKTNESKANRPNTCTLSRRSKGRPLPKKTLVFGELNMHNFRPFLF